MDAIVDQWNMQADHITDMLSDLANHIESGTAVLPDCQVRMEKIVTRYDVLCDLFYRLDAENRKTKREAFQELKNSYFKLASYIRTKEAKQATEKQSRSSGGDTTIPFAHSTLLDITRYKGLPPIDLPKFNGRLDEWTVFKTTFKNEMVRLDIDNITAFHYLKKALVGDAANSLKILTPGENSYEEAWRLLSTQYEHVRLIAASHIDAILAYPVLAEASHRELKDMEHSVRQHLADLKTLKVVPSDYFVIRALERTLPTKIKDRWIKKTSIDKIPDLEFFFTFLQETSNYLYAQGGEAKGNEAPAKRTTPQNEKGNKYRRGNGQARALVTSSTLSCYFCSGDHTIYRCSAFAKLTVQQRWDAVRTKKLCRKCLRSHEGKCEARNCKKCDKEHNSLLHEDQKADSSAKKP